jgi:multiple sugar transport system permease protein
MKPAIAVQMIFSFVSSWNNYFIPALLLDKAEMKTVPIMIAQLHAARTIPSSTWARCIMFILLAILPVLIRVHLPLQIHHQGRYLGSVKG